MKSIYFLLSTRIACLIFLLLIVVACGSSVSQSDEPEPAVENLPEGWTHDGLFTNVCASPTNMTTAADGAMYVNDRADNRIILFSSDGTLEEWADTGDV